MVLKVNNLDLSKITFSDVKLDPRGRKMVFVNLNGGKILLQTPKMFAPNGLKKWAGKTPAENDNFELELSFGGEQGTDKNSVAIAELHKKFKQLDEMIINKILENSPKWVGKKLTKDGLELLYKPIVKVPKDKEGNILNYPSRFKAKIDRDSETGKFLSNKRDKNEILFFNENNERLDINEHNAEDMIQRNCQVITIIELVYLNISSTGINVKWKLVQSKVFKNNNTITGYAIVDDDDEEETALPDDLDSENDIVKSDPDSEPIEEHEVEEVVEEPIEEHEVEVVEEIVEKTVKPKGRGKK